MKKDLLQHSWMFFLFALLFGLLIWGIWFVDNIENKISIIGIVAVIVAAFTSVLTVSINNKKAKEREYDLHVLKEKQKVYEHFYNSFFELLNGAKNGKMGPSSKTISEVMLFKRGLMNWGSERLIKKYIDYDNKLTQHNTPYKLLEDGNKFLKEIRQEMGFQDSNDLNLIDIILTAEAREELKKNQ